MRGGGTSKLLTRHNANFLVLVMYFILAIAMLTLVVIVV